LETKAQSWCLNYAVPNNRDALVSKVRNSQIGMLDENEPKLFDTSKHAWNVMDEISVYKQIPIIHEMPRDGWRVANSWNTHYHALPCVETYSMRRNAC
jgi:hypothetical protein